MPQNSCDRYCLPHVRIEVRRGRARKPVRLVRQPVFVIGKSPDCDLVLGDPQFPEMHSYLFLSPDSVSLGHLGRSPGWTVNGEPVHSAALADGDRLRTGPYEFVVRIERAATGDVSQHGPPPVQHDRGAVWRHVVPVDQRARRLLGAIHAAAYPGAAERLQSAMPWREERVAWPFVAVRRASA